MLNDTQTLVFGLQNVFNLFLQRAWQLISCKRKPQTPSPELCLFEFFLLLWNGCISNGTEFKYGRIVSQSGETWCV